MWQVHGLKKVTSSSVQYLATKIHIINIKEWCINHLLQFIVKSFNALMYHHVNHSSPAPSSVFFLTCFCCCMAWNFCSNSGTSSHRLATGSHVSLSSPHHCTRQQLLDCFNIFFTSYSSSPWTSTSSGCSGSTHFQLSITHCSRWTTNIIEYSYREGGRSSLYASLLIFCLILNRPINISDSFNKLGRQ